MFPRHICKLHRQLLQSVSFVNNGSSTNRLFVSITHLCKFHTSHTQQQDLSVTDTNQYSNTEIKAIDTPQQNVPIITSRKLQFPNRFRAPRQAWLETLSTIEDRKLGIIDLHPDIFAVAPRLDVIQVNITWQQMYNRINYDFARSRAEMPGGGRKPWPQKGLGKARHGSIRSPLFIGGGSAHGPRGPKSYFYMLTEGERIIGLTSTLSVKYAQDDLHIVDSLDIPTDDSQYLEKLAVERDWGYSVLFIDEADIMPQNIAVAVDEVRGFTLMPTYGLNVMSMLKHETLVLTLAAVEKIESMILYHLHKPGISRINLKRLAQFKPSRFKDPVIDY